MAFLFSRRPSKKVTIKIEATKMLSPSLSASHITMDNSRGKWCSLTGALVFRDKDMRWSTAAPQNQVKIRFLSFNIQVNSKQILWAAWNVNLVRIIAGSLITAPHLWICLDFSLQLWFAEVQKNIINHKWGKATSYLAPLLHPWTITLTVVKRH